LHLPILAMALFAITFAAVVVRVFLGSAREQDHLAGLPFAEPVVDQGKGGGDHE
jgi:hypothetical protein